jgi:hypothetical protein
VQAVRAPSDGAARAGAAIPRRATSAPRSSTRRWSTTSASASGSKAWQYAELAIGQAALETPGYAPVAGAGRRPGFQYYRNRKTWWDGQIDETLRTAGRPGETRFYYSGMAQALLLDRLSPGWKTRAFEPDVMLVELLREAVR